MMENKMVSIVIESFNDEKYSDAFGRLNGFGR